MSRRLREDEIVTDRAALEQLLGYGSSAGTVAVRGGGRTLDTAKKNLLLALTEFGNMEALLGRFGGEQPPPTSLIRWVDVQPTMAGEIIVDRDSGDKVGMRMRPERETTYVAHRVAAGGSSTGGADWVVSPPLNGQHRLTWQAVMEAVGDNAAWIASGWLEIPAAVKPTADDLDPVKFAERMFGKKADAPAPATDVEGKTDAPAPATDVEGTSS